VPTQRCHFEPWPLWPSKVGQIKNPGRISCILIRYTNDKNLEMIQTFVQELWHFLCFRFWPPGGQTKNQTGPKLGMWVTLTQWYICTKIRVNCSSGYETCPANGRRTPKQYEIKVSSRYLNFILSEGFHPRA
jgi:hypothetical protein